MSTLDYYNENAQAFVQGTVNVNFTATQERFLRYLPSPSNDATIAEQHSSKLSPPSTSTRSDTQGASNIAGYAPLILDLGCGSGRDSKFFLSQGYRVEAVDGSLELCRLAEKLIGQPVKCMLFQDLSAVEKYDGIWACASLLHLPLEELINVLEKCATALRPNGIMYLSFKYGTTSGLRNGRWFTDLTPEGLSQLLNAIPSEQRSFNQSTGTNITPKQDSSNQLPNNHLTPKQDPSNQSTNAHITPKLQILDQWLSSDVRPDRQAEQWVNAIVRRKT